MIIDYNIIKETDIISSYEEYLPKLFSLYLWNKLTKSNGEMYGRGFYFKKTIQNKEWIKSDPCSTITRMRNKNQCVYCDKDLNVKYGVGDHIVGKKMNSALWLVPCCTVCNSSKGNRDLLYWWCIMKNKMLLDLKKDVLATYIRGKYRLLTIENKIKDQPTQDHIDILRQLKGVKFG